MQHVARNETANAALVGVNPDLENRPSCLSKATWWLDFLISIFLLSHQRKIWIYRTKSIGTICCLL